MSESKNYTSMIAKYGTSDIDRGKLTGTTDTDYFYFLCPKCDGGGSEVMRILDVGNVEDLEYKYKDLRPQPKKLFHFGFELYCEKCKTHSVVKLSNCHGLQGGKIADSPAGLKHKVIGPNSELTR